MIRRVIWFDWNSIYFNSISGSEMSKRLLCFFYASASCTGRIDTVFKIRMTNTIYILIITRTVVWKTNKFWQRKQIGEMSNRSRSHVIRSFHIHGRSHASLNTPRNFLCKVFSTQSIRSHPLSQSVKQARIQVRRAFFRARLSEFLTHLKF